MIKINFLCFLCKKIGARQVELIFLRSSQHTQILGKIRQPGPAKLFSGADRWSRPGGDWGAPARSAELQLLDQQNKTSPQPNCENLRCLHFP
jgi:hypothetical protein